MWGMWMRVQHVPEPWTRCACVGYRALHIPILLLEEVVGPPPINMHKGSVLPSIVFWTVIFSEHYVDMKKGHLSAEFLCLL